MNRKKEGIEEKAIQKVNKKAKIMVPLIFMLILTIIIPTIIYVGKNIIQQPTETAEIEKQEESEEEKISAASVRVEAGNSYTVPRDGVYKIELHGGKSADISISYSWEKTIVGNPGKKVTGYVSLTKGDILTTTDLVGGKVVCTGFTLDKFDGASGVDLKLNGNLLGYASGGPGLTVIDTDESDYENIKICDACAKLECSDIYVVHEYEVKAVSASYQSPEGRLMGISDTYGRCFCGDGNRQIIRGVIGGGGGSVEPRNLVNCIILWKNGICQQ